MGVLTRASETTLEWGGMLAVGRQIRSLIYLHVHENSMHSYFFQLVIPWERRMDPGGPRSPPEVPNILWAAMGGLASSLPRWVWRVPPLVS